ncbi:hypothetical protein FKB34_09175 [Glycocaulis profundi]|nr:hypothetical protein FKB34_09175 [Glycocaulis profundi]
MPQEHGWDEFTVLFAIYLESFNRKRGWIGEKDLRLEYSIPVSERDFLDIVVLLVDRGLLRRRWRPWGQRLSLNPRASRVVKAYVLAWLSASALQINWQLKQILSDARPNVAGREVKVPDGWTWLNLSKEDDGGSMHPVANSRDLPKWTSPINWVKWSVVVAVLTLLLGFIAWAFAF